MKEELPKRGQMSDEECGSLPHISGTYQKVGD